MSEPPHLRLKENHRCESFPCDGHFALTTFLAGDYDGKEGDHDDDDTYFVAARVLTYQLLLYTLRELDYKVPPRSSC
jgi:hypothetical protein